MVYKSLNFRSPLYIQELVNLRKPNQDRLLRIDNDKLILEYLRPAKQDYKNRSFSFAAPNLWNSLPFDVRSSESVNIFKRNLKTFYFKLWTKESPLL